MIILWLIRNNSCYSKVAAMTLNTINLTTIEVKHAFGYF